MRSANVVDHINMYLTSTNTLSFADIHQSILEWPAKGNTYLASNGINIENALAPFIDWNNNGIYDPENGDYPNIKGNQALFWVMNDVAGSHGSGGNKLYVEVQMMAYAYQSNVPVINNTTFYDYTIIRKKPTPLHEAYFSLYFLDNLQNFRNYFGCDTASNLFFTYESLSSEFNLQNAPIHLLKLIDCNKEKKMSSFVADSRVLGSTGFSHLVVGSIRNIQKGIGKCGLPFYYGGNGRHGCGVTDEETKFMFSGNPSDSTQWSMQYTDPDSNACLSLSDINDRYVYMNFGPYTINSFEPLKFTFASTLVPTDNLEYPLGKINMVPPAETIEQYYCTTCKDGNYYGVNPPDFTSIDNIDVLEVQIYPNPMSKSFEINTSNNIENVELIDTYGKSIKKWEGKQISYSVDKMSRGVYFLQVAINGQRIIKKVIIE